MGLKIRNLYEIFEDLMEWVLAKTDKITDFNVGSAIRTLFEAFSLQLEEFYFAMKQNVLYAIENSVYESFGFNKKSATRATGNVTIEFEDILKDDIIIPKGTMFCTSAYYGYKYFESTEDVPVIKGSVECEVKVQGSEDGKKYNIPAGAITAVVTTNSAIRRVYNKNAFTNGKEAESQSDRKARFNSYINSLSRGTKDSIIYGALQVDGVQGVYCDDSYIGYVQLYAHDSDGNLSDELRANIENALVSYRSAGIEVVTLRVVKLLVNLNIRVMIQDNHSTEAYQASIKSIVTSRINDNKVSENLYISDLVYTIKSAYPDIVLTIDTDNSDVIINPNEIIRSGNINIQCLNKSNWRQ